MSDDSRDHPQDDDAPPDTQSARPLVTQAVAAMLPGVPLIDVAATVNQAMDAFEEGDDSGVRHLLTYLRAVRDASDRAEQEG